MKKKSNIN